MICRVNCTNQTRHIVEIDSENRIFLLEISVDGQASQAVFLIQGRPCTMPVMDKKSFDFRVMSSAKDGTKLSSLLEFLIYQADCPGRKNGIV